MNIFQNNLKFLAVFIIQLLLMAPAFSIDLDATVKDNTRNNYTKTQQTVIQKQAVSTEKEQVTKPNNEVTVQAPSQEVKMEIKQDLPKVPNLPKNVSSNTVAPINTQYTGQVPQSDAFIPATDIKFSPLIVTNLNNKQRIAQQKTVTENKYPTAILAKGTEIRVVNQSKIDDYLCEGQEIIFISTQDISTAYIKLPKGTKYKARVVDSHRPQITCNGGLVGLRIMSVNANGLSQPINAGIINVNNNDIYFSNLKGKRTYIKNVSKKAKWGQNKFKEWSKTAHELANDGAWIIVSPVPYVGGCVLAAASTVSSPITALFAKGEHVNIPANTAFTIKLYENAKLRY